MSDVTMPRLSDTMEEGTIAAWLKKPGEQVSKGDVIAQIETDKATMDLTAFEAGTLQEILAPEGATVAIGEPVARIGSGSGAAAPSQEEATPPAAEETGSVEPQTPQARENVAEAPEPTAAQPDAPQSDGSPARGEARRTSDQTGAETPSKAAEAPEPTAAQPDAPQSDGSPARGQGSRTSDQAGPVTPSESESSGGAQRTLDASGPNGKVRASPMARHIAAEHGLKLEEIQGTGPQGRVIRADVEAALSGQAESAGEARPEEPERQPQAAAQPQDGDERVQLSQMRRTIARRMAESTRTIPHFYLTATVDATELGTLRKQINAQTADAGIKITFNDLIVKGAALAIRQVPDVNVSFAEDSLIRHSRVNVGIAVATNRGLIVPVLRDADQKSLGAIARETRDLAERANTGKLQPPDYSGGTFTVSNLGMFGVEQFQAVINPPESAILAVGAITREPADYQGEIALRDRLRLTLSVDHRALDGAIGARYLQALKALLEKPMLLLV